MTEQPSILVLGSGMAALGASHQLNEAGVRPRLFDKNAYPGGHTATFEDGDGFLFDDGPHISFTKNTRLQDLFAGNVGGAFETLRAYVNNYYRGVWVKHPAQVNLHNLPLDLKVRCLLDFIEAAAAEDRQSPANYLDWLVASFGETFATHFPAVYGKKYHTIAPEKMSTVWIGPRLYQPNLEEVLRGALQEETQDVHYVSHFRYPSEGGFMSYLEPFLEKADLALSHEVVQIDPVRRIVSFANGRSENYDQLVSSIPLPKLIPLISGVPDDIRAAAKMLACTTCVTVNLGLARNDVSRATWSYVYDEDKVFTRLNFPHLMSPGTCPPGCGSIQAECYYSEKYRPLDVAPEDLIEPVIRDLVAIGLLREDEEILCKSARVIPFANVIFDLDREIALPKVHDYLDRIGVIYAGRFGEWGYHWTDEAFVSGEKGARKALRAAGLNAPDYDLE